MIQQARELLADTIPELDPKWSTKLDTSPKLNATLTVQIGHTPPTQATFRANRFELPLTWWVNEGNSGEGAADLYDALSREDGADSLVQQLLALDWVEGFSVSFVGARIDGPTGFLSADSVISILGLKLPDGS